MTTGFRAIPPTVCTTPNCKDCATQNKVMEAIKRLCEEVAPSLDPEGLEHYPDLEEELRIRFWAYVLKAAAYACVKGGMNPCVAALAVEHAFAKAGPSEQDMLLAQLPASATKQ